MTIYIITEGTPATGMGHLARCSAIADAFEARGFRVVFVVDGGDDTKAYTGERESVRFDWKTDTERLEKLIGSADICIVDSYLAMAETYSTISRLCKAALYLDDYNRITYPHGTVVNGTIGITPGFYSASAGVEYLAGGSYIILRKEFWSVPARPVNPSMKKIVVTMGATDIAGLTPRITQLLCALVPDCEKHVVTGGSDTAKQQALRAVADSNTFFYEKLSAGQMRSLIERCDAAISAAGQTMNELARCGVPSLVFQVADNQRYNIEGWQKAGFIGGVTTLDTLPRDLASLASERRRGAMSEAGRKAVDGKGAARIVSHAVCRAIGDSITIRRAEERDLMPLFDLANDPVVRENSFSTEPIPLESHREWFSRVLASENTCMYIMEAGGEFCAQVRFDMKETETVVSVSIASGYRGLGLGADILRGAVTEFSAEKQGFPVITAYIKDKNIASKRSFAAAGFSQCGEGRMCLKN